MNLSSLQDQIGKLLGDPSNTRWDLTTLTTRINLAQVEIQGYSNAVKTSETLTPVASARSVSLNASTMNVLRVNKTLSDGTTIIPLSGIDREELDYRFPNWQNWADGEPQYFFYDATLQTLNLVPKPDAANAITNGLTVWESRKPADLAGASDVPFDSNNQMIPYHMAIVHWVVAVCFMDDGSAESLAKAHFHKSGSMKNPGEFEKELGRILAEFDIPDAVPRSIQWKPQGGRLGYLNYPSKGNPFGF